MNEYRYYKMCIKKDDDYFEEQINFRTVYSTDTDIIKEENSKACIEYDLSSGQLSLECNFDNIGKYITNDEFVAIRNDSEVETSLLDMVYGPMTFSDNIGIRTYDTYGRRKARENFLNEVCDIINSHCGVKVSWRYITDDADLNHQRSIMTISNFEKIMNETKRKTLEWLAIKRRLSEKGYNKNDFKIKIGYCHYDADEGYPLYLNVAEDYYNSFRLDTDKKYNSARSIFELIIYKEEWYDTMYFSWDNEALETYKYLFFKNKDEFKEEYGSGATDFYDSEFDLMCWEEEMLFRG